MNGIQEVSGSIPFISTIEALKTIGFQGFLLFCGTFILPGTFLTRILCTKTWGFALCGNGNNVHIDLQACVWIFERSKDL